MNRAEAVKKGFDLAVESDPRLKRIVEALAEAKDVVVIGGSPRDWILGREPRDIDIVVDMPAEELHAAVQPIGGFELNRFGGYAWLKDGISVDLWSLGRTWAFREELLPNPTMARLPLTVPINLDSLVVSVCSGEVWEAGFDDALRTRCVDFAFMPNVICFSVLNILRAVQAARKYEFSLSSRILAFARKQLASGMSWKRIEAMQLSHYKRIVLDLETLRTFLQLGEDLV